MWDLGSIFRTVVLLWQIHGGVNPLPWFHSGNAEFEQNLATLNDIRHGHMQSVRIFQPRIPNSEADHVTTSGLADANCLRGYRVDFRPRERI